MKLYDQAGIARTKTIQLLDLIDRVINGEKDVFTWNNSPIAKLVAAHQEKSRPQFGSAKAYLYNG